jgi:hypothetical protein
VAKVDSIGGLQVDPVFCWEVEEGEQLARLVGDLRDGFRPLGPERVGKARDGRLSHLRQLLSTLALLPRQRSIACSPCLVKKKVRRAPTQVDQFTGIWSPGLTFSFALIDQ